MKKKNKRQLARECIQWYINNRRTYEHLAKKVESIMEELLLCNSIPFHSITSRAKEIISYTEKVNKEKYKDPLNQIKDMAGIRVIAYVESDTKKISDLIEKYFEVDKENSINKRLSLDVDQFGYRSIHYIVKLSQNRLDLPEYKQFIDKYLEIQVRTILEHAWAEISHDREYKFRGILPPQFKRELSGISAILETVDGKFDNLVKQIDEYSNTVENKIYSGDFNIPIDTASLKSFMKSKFNEKLIMHDSFEVYDDLIEELQLFGINTLSDLDKIIPTDYQHRIFKFSKQAETYYSILRDFMIIYDADLYFSKAWRDSWQGLSTSAIELYESYNIDIYRCLEEYKIDYYPDDALDSATDDLDYEF